MQRLYHLTLRAVTWIMCVLLLDVTSGLKEYRSCLDVKNDLGSQALDGEYVVFLPWKRNVAITVYCYGSDQLCADKYPREVWSERGRTEYTRISVDLGSLAINTGDFTFTNTSGPNKIRYGEAGDKYASGSDCSPMGTFEIDLTGTPFTVSSSVSWYYSECFCGSDPQRLYGSRKAAEERCNYRCTGNSSQVCGGHWYISVYKTVVQQVTGRCGGYPGRCYPTTAAGQRTGNLVLDIMDETVIEDGQRCPAGYHAETCTCFEASCNGARFDGDMCVSSTGKAQVTCRPGDPAHVMLYNKEGSGWVECPKGSKIVGCTYWASYPVTNYQGQGVVDANTGRCTVVNATVNVQARCKEYFCGCENGAHCNQITGKCECDQGYYGDKCETFDYCSYYEEQINQTACSSTGVCTPVYKYTVTASGGDRAADRCVFPFDWGDLTYNTCVQDNAVGPPFACAGEFSLSGSMKNRRTYIDLGQWSPGPRYTVAAWVSPWKIDTMRQTVVGGASECNDFGINFNSGTFRGYLKLSKECTRDLDTGPALAKPGTWYMIAITSNASHASIYLNGELKETNTVLLNHIPTTSGFWIGSAVCCTQDYFRGQIKVLTSVTVKAWNRALTVEEINRSMYNGGVENSTYEALYDGLVGHWELGDTHGPTCSGSDVIDHGGADWNLRDGEFIMGIHCNISRFVVPAGATVLVKRYDGTSGGFVDITALDAQIDGYIDAVGAGYRGGVTSKIAGDAGVEGESYTGAGSKGLQENRGGGGGGIGGSSMADGTGRSGGGGGYGEPGAGGVKTVGDRTGLGAGGRMYGDPELNHLYMGSGGGSGGNAKDLTTNPNETRYHSITTSCMGCPDACDQRSPVNCRGNSTTSCWDMSGPGGGGSGGTIFLSAKLVNVGYQKLWAMGGEGGAGGSHCCGGAGGRGRIRIDSVIMKGTVNDQHGILKAITRQEQYMDHSQYGQKQINYKTTIYGNEVYRGCFRDDVNNRTLAVAITDTVVIRAKQTPDYCKQLCRKRNFMYSGTEGGSLCFCDNHLDMSRKVADSDCNTTCSGNPLWNCGGTRRIQVFGPPPSAPAVGHGILPSCRPWCVTADATTNDPKWGMCELGGHEAAGISSWDMQCKCPPGRTGTGCDQICPSWTYGDGCRRNCTCNVNNTAVCESSAGTCQCKPGFIGPTCKPGWYGTTCNYPCPEGRFGANCSQNCAPCNHGTCSPFDGQCRCYAGYKLPFCAELCDMTNFGQDCEQDCACSGQPCHPITGTCICGPGYLGDRCQSQCPQGTWGQNCLKNCACQHTFGCDPVDGTCNCGPGFVGERCEIRCPDDSNS
ncbi:MEG11-like protein [Mya arenaria]|uniref:MEG11-like protein n=1 Tax=Mya arenaria TaxID=6604 RepID=A0ABY7E6B6_MYAAR|nr:MEG11-like protein [Mya arenaria]